MSSFATGVTVATTQAKTGEAYGLTVSAFSSVSLNPPMVLVCLNNKRSGLEHFLAGRRFAINILGEDQEAISGYFATSGTDRTEASGHYRRSDSGLPVLSDCLSTMECQIVSTFPGGDHTILLGQVTAVVPSTQNSTGSPLIYFQGQYTALVK
jgi:flavin reductase (DIM6/NTAB) family NADH-FMN oxidoreductase RutF